MDRSAVATPYSELVFTERALAGDIALFLSDVAVWRPIDVASIKATGNTVTATVAGIFATGNLVTITVTAEPQTTTCSTPEGE